MTTLWAKKLTKTYRPPLRLGDLLRGRVRPAEVPKRVLNEVSLHVDEGEIVGLMGPNGAGKTTLLKTLSTLVVPDEGEAGLAGYRLSDEDGVRRSIGLVTGEERSFYWRLTGRENLGFFAAMHGLSSREVTSRLKQFSGLLHIDDFIDKRFDTYSSGMKQRLALARALLHRPRILLLDEPTRSIDPVESFALRSAITELVDEEATAVLLVSHNLRELEMLCRRVLVMRGGKIVFNGSLSSLRAEVSGGDQYILDLDGPIEGWESSPGVSEGKLSMETGYTELAVGVAPESNIGEVVAALHSRGGRIEAIRPHKDALEKALEKLEFGGEEVGITVPAEPDEKPAAPRPVSRFVQIAAFMRRDIRIQLSYRFAFAIGFFGIIFNVTVFFYLSQLVGTAQIPSLQRYGTDFFPFLLIGIAFRGYLGVALLQAANALRSEQMMGTLEMLLASPLKVSTFLTASTSYHFLYQSFTVAGYLLLGLVMGSLSLSRMNLPVAALVMIPTVATFAAIGMLSASFLMTFKRGDPINFFFNAGATLFGGVFFPIEVLPDSLQVVSKALPITYSLQAMRKALLTGAGLREVGYELLVLTLFALVLVPLGLLAFGVALRKAKRDGTLGQF
jgi:ABC-2 type transport system permease protein